jgi:ADP-heptose:LPS heptosyltransferase
MDSAAILTHLDLLITPDSALTHLAGAMGRRVWTLIATDTDWRWLGGEGKTGWYPTMRLFRQARCGDWAGVLTRLCHALPA